LVTSAGLDLEGGSIAAASPLEAALRARDVDDLDVLFTRAAIELLWHDENLQGTKVLFNTETGTSKYTAMISADWTRQPGQYTLSVRVANGASDRTGNAGSCEVLRRSITVTSDSTQLILALVLVGIVLGVFALGSCLLYKNRESAKKFFLSFLSFEGMLATDIALEAWDFAGTPSPHGSSDPAPDGRLNGAPIAGECFFFFEVRKQSSKPWVSKLVLAYTIFFALVCAVSLVCIVVKLRLLVLKLRSRVLGPRLAYKTKEGSRRLSIGGVPIAPRLVTNEEFSNISGEEPHHKEASSSNTVLRSGDAQTSAHLSKITELKSKFADHRADVLLAYCDISGALLADLPLGALPTRVRLAECRSAMRSTRRSGHAIADNVRMHTGIMNSVYLVRSILECVDHDLVCKQSEVKVCNLDPSARTVVLVLSNLTSAAMLGYKAARNACACLRWFALCCDHCLCCVHSRGCCKLVCAEGELLRIKWREVKKLEAERAALIDELEQSAAEAKTEAGNTRAAWLAELRGASSWRLSMRAKLSIGA
jgi:hypothetical protein